MVSTRSRARVNKQIEAGPSGLANITPDLATILNAQAKMQQELADLKKHNIDEMEALQQENSRLRRKIEVDPTQKGKAKETSDVPGSVAFHHTKEESECNPTPHTFTTTQQTPILSTHHTHFHSTLPRNTMAPTPATTLPTTHISPYNMPTTLHTIHIPPYPPHISRLKPIAETTPLELPNGCTIKLGIGLESEQRDILIHTLVSNTDLFAWSATDLPEVDPHVASHMLSIYKEARYVS